MALLKTVNPEAAEGPIKEAYDVFMKRAGMVPKPFEMMSVSPGLLQIQAQVLDYFMQHKTLSFPLMTHIRYLVAQRYDYAFCTSFNRDLLKMQGMGEDEVQAVSSDPQKAPLEDKDKAMLLFVLKAVKQPDEVTQKDVDALHEMGWTDNDIMDAVFHGTGMIAPSILMRAFKMDT